MRDFEATREPPHPLALERVRASFTAPMMTARSTKACILEPLAGTRLAPELVAAYVHAHYQVGQGDSAIPFRVASACPRLDALLRRGTASFRPRGLASARVEAAFLTACNPHSQPLPWFANRRQRTRLERHLKCMKLPWVVGCGRGADWPEEPSLLVFGVGRRHGDELARRFRQNAWIMLSTAHPPRLVLTR